MSKDYAPLATRMEFAIRRERQIPELLQQAEQNIVSVDAITQRIAAADAAGSVRLLQDLGAARVRGRPRRRAAGRSRERQRSTRWLR